MSLLSYSFYTPFSHATENIHEVTTEHITIKASPSAKQNNIDTENGLIAPTLTKSRIASTPQGDNAPLNQLLLRLPGVVQDSYGEVHVRGAHGGLTYRINGISLPKGIKGFGQEIDSRLISSLKLYTGALPAEFGFRTAGIIDIQTKTGKDLKQSNISLYGGSYNSFKPSFQTGGTYKNIEYFNSFSFLENNIGIENPTNSFRPVHDKTKQFKNFSYLSYRLNDTDKLSLIASTSYGNFHLPNTPNLPALYPYTNQENTNSRYINDQQDEQDHYLIFSYTHQNNKLSYQISPYIRYGRIKYTPDTVNDLIYQNVAEKELNDFLTPGMETHLSYKFSAQHHLSFGTIHRYTYERLHTFSTVFPTDSEGKITSPYTENIRDNSHNHGLENGIFVSDHLSLPYHLTLISGLRYDRFDSNFDHEQQVSPRFNLLWYATKKLAIHTGYSRFFAPPAPQYIHPSTLEKFANTTNAPENFIDTPTKVERTRIVDLGLQYNLTKNISLSIDGFYKWLKNMTDLGQFGRAVILAPFSYRYGHIYGTEASIEYQEKYWSFYGNFSYLETAGKNLNSAQYQFEQDELNYIATHNIHLDHQAKYTASSGLSWHNTHHLFALDFIYGNGLRSGFANLGKQPAYAIFNSSYQYQFHLAKKLLTARFDVLNILDHRYQLRDGSGIGVYQAQYGQRRGVYFTLATTL